jgi:hypothetical protein
MRHVWLWFVIPFLLCCTLWYCMGGLPTATLLTTLGGVLVVNAFHLWWVGNPIDAIAVFLCGVYLTSSHD